MASAALEKSLDEIIGDRPSQGRRGASRSSRGPRNTPYARETRDSRGPRDEMRSDYRPVEGDRWSHDRYDRRPGYPDDEERPHSVRHDRNGRDGRATRLKISNIHYDLSEREVRDLFERIAPVSRFMMRFDRAGRSEGVAYVTFDRYVDAKLAITQYDGQSALGQRLEVELDSVVPPPRNLGRERDLASRISNGPSDGRDAPRRAGPSRGGRRGRGDRGPGESKPSSARRGPVTADDLDAELDNYINQRNDGSSQKVADSGAGADGSNGGGDGMMID